MRKKVLGVLLSTAMVSVALTGCGGDSGSSSSTTTGGNTTTTDTATSGDDAGSSASSEVENTVTGDASAEDAFVVWGWNDDIKNILDNEYKEANADDYARIVFVNTGGSDTYQTKIDEILADSSNELYPDVMGLEVDYVKKYVNSPSLLSGSDLGITDDDTKNMYQYNKDLGSDADGNMRAFFWQATPGCFQLRADLAKKFLGTTDPAELQDKYFSSWDKIVEAAKKVNDASKGKCKLFSGYTEAFRVFSNSRATGWYDADDKITIDPNMEEYMEVAKQLYDGELTFNTDQWSEDWNANMTGDGKKTNAAIAYCGCPWFTYWCLNTDTWTGQTILVQGPQQFFWGGTGLAATAECSDKDMAGRLIKWITCNTDGLVAINGRSKDFVNSTEALALIQKDKKASASEMLFKGAKQNIIEFYLPLADSIDASTATAEDQTINDLWASQVSEYAAGNVDKDAAIEAFKASVHDTYDYLQA